MGFDSLNLSHKEKYEVQAALKEIIQGIIREFEQDRIVWEETGYRDMPVDMLFQLHVAVRDLKFRAEKIKIQELPVDEHTNTILNDIEKITTEIIEADQTWEKNNIENKITIDAELANILGNGISDLKKDMKQLQEMYP